MLMGNEFLVTNSVKVRSHSGATTVDLIDYVRATVWKKPNFVII